MQAGAKHLSSVTLELGGKSPLIIDGSIPMQEVVEKVVWGKLINLGQTCIAPDYIVIKEEFSDQFVDAFITHVENIFGKNIVNTAMLGSLVNIPGLLKLESAKIAIKKKFSDKGNDIVEKNIKAVNQAIK